MSTKSLRITGRFRKLVKAEPNYAEFERKWGFGKNSGCNIANGVAMWCQSNNAAAAKKYLQYHKELDEKAAAAEALLAQNEPEITDPDFDMADPIPAQPPWPPPPREDLVAATLPPLRPVNGQLQQDLKMMAQIQGKKEAELIEFILAKAVEEWRSTLRSFMA